MENFKVIETQEELNRIIGERLKRQEEKIRAEYEDYDTLKTKHESYEKQISELNQTIEASNQNSKANEEELNKLQAQIKEYELSSMKTRIALENGLPYSLAWRLQGEDEESILSDAKNLSGFISKPQLAPLKSTEPEDFGDGKEGAYRQLLSNL